MAQSEYPGVSKTVRVPVKQTAFNSASWVLNFSDSSKLGEVAVREGEGFIELLWGHPSSHRLDAAVLRIKGKERRWSGAAQCLVSITKENFRQTLHGECSACFNALNVLVHPQIGALNVSPKNMMEQEISLPVCKRTIWRNISTTKRVPNTVLHTSRFMTGENRSRWFLILKTQ